MKDSTKKGWTEIHTSVLLAFVLASVSSGCGPGSSASGAVGRGATDGPLAADGRSGADASPSQAQIRRHAGGFPIRAVCTIGMVADLAVNVGGSRVAVEGIMGEGVDPHLYKASPGDLQRLGSADIIFYNGLHLEGKMADILVRLARTRPTFAVTEDLPPELLREPPEFQGQYDPHVWFDVSLWARCLDRVVHVLAEFDPPHAGEYRERGSAYRKRLEALHGEVKKQLAEIPPGGRVLVTAHDAFGYFGRAYEVEVRGIQGMSTDAEAGVRELSRLADFIAERKLKAVFVETSVPERFVRALVEGCQARGHRVVIGGQLYSDAMGKPGTPEGTYEGMVRRNVDTIVRALQ